MRIAVFSSILACLAAVASCSELRSADEVTPDAGGTDAGPRGDAGDDDDVVANDGGRDATPVLPTCDGPCPVETVFALPQPQLLATLALDEQNVYVALPNQAIYRCPKTGCEAPTTLFKGSSSALTVADGKVYWAAGTKLMACATSGCGESATTVLEEVGLISQLIHDGPRLVWITSSAENELVRSCLATACTKEKVVDVRNGIQLRDGMATGEGRVAFITLNSEAMSCLNDRPCTNGAHLGSLGFVDLAIGNGTAFWTTEAAEIVGCALPGCADKPKILTTAKSPRKLVADSTHVYWRSSGSKTLERCPVTGCTSPEIVATNVASTLTQNLALDDTHLYWLTNSGVYRRQK